ncbi:MAG: hypothetical protein HON04_02410, partial [Planctomicrobium sp.]|nr:hypothetical protein [Planctomicrobium sp.]
MTQPPFSSDIHLVKVPNLYSEGVPIKLMNWTTPIGSPVIVGERIAELLIDSILFYLESDGEGILSKYLVPSGAIVKEGQAIA